MTSKKLMAGLFLAGMALDATAAQYVTPPVAMGPPVGYTRQVWCVVQNADVKAYKTTTSLVFGGNGGLVSDPVTQTIPAGQVAWTSGAAGQGMVYCRFNLPNKRVRGYITLQDTPLNGNSATQYTTYLMLGSTPN